MVKVGSHTVAMVRPGSLFSTPSTQTSMAALGISTIKALKMEVKEGRSATPAVTSSVIIVSANWRCADVISSMGIFKTLKTDFVFEWTIVFII